jgi:hypothetical protein
MVEGLSLTSYESLSMGVPVVSSDVGGQKELISDDCGRIIKMYQDPAKDILNYNYSEKEINDYVNAILDILNDDKIKNNCRKRILGGFTIDQMVEKMSSNIEKTINEGTIVNKNISSDINFAERYLVLFNEINRQHYDEHDNIRKATIRDILWRYKSWRKFMRNYQKTKIYSFFKKQ